MYWKIKVQILSYVITETSKMLYIINYTALFQMLRLKNCQNYFGGSRSKTSKTSINFYMTLMKL